MYKPQTLTDQNQGYLFRYLVAASATFQSLTRSADEVESLERVHYPWIREEDEDCGGGVLQRHEPPYAVISDELSNNRVETMGVANWQGKASLLLSLFLFVPDEVSRFGDMSSRFWMDEHCGLIRQEMLALARTGEPHPGVTHINLVACEVQEPPFQVPQSEFTVGDLRQTGPLPDLWALTYACEFF